MKKNNISRNDLLVFLVDIALIFLFVYFALGFVVYNYISPPAYSAVYKYFIPHKYELINLLQQIKATEIQINKTYDSEETGKLIIAQVKAEQELGKATLPLKEKMSRIKASIYKKHGVYSEADKMLDDLNKELNRSYDLKELNNEIIERYQSYVQNNRSQRIRLKKKLLGLEITLINYYRINP